jgi:hypothetical protein
LIKFLQGGKDLNSKNVRSKTIKLLPIVLIAILIGMVSAAVLTAYYANFTATVKTPDVRLVAGPDSTVSPTVYPAASVTVASTYDSAAVAFSLFPSATNTPQPATYYTNLLQVTNAGATSHSINSITISGITGASNLGSITIYYYATQTETPQTGSPVGSVTLTSSSTGTINLLSSSNAIAAGATNYF